MAPTTRKLTAAPTKQLVRREIALLLDSLDEAFDKKSWHGPNLRSSIRGVSPVGAAWRPAPGRHSIQELTVHAAYWKYVVRRRITGEKRGSFALPGSNFFPRPAANAVLWKADIAAITELPASAPQTLHLIRGAAAHDLYHAGQIRLLRRLKR
jgi:hypothetical protein